MDPFVSSKENKTLQELTENTVPHDFKLFAKLPGIDLSEKGAKDQLVKKVIRKGKDLFLMPFISYLLTYYYKYFNVRREFIKDLAKRRFGLGSLRCLLHQWG